MASSSAVGTGRVLKTGHLFKQGGSYRNWKKRYFILRKTTLSYYAAEGDRKPKGVIDLTHGRGVRSKVQCQLEEEEWPSVATGELAFGLAMEDRTFYIYGCDQAAVDDWKSVLQERIGKVGTLDSNYNEDCPRKQQCRSSKIVHGGRHRAKQRKKTVSDEEHSNDLISPSGVACSKHNAETFEDAPDVKEDEMIYENTNDNADEECIYQNTVDDAS